jgi:glutaredoxin
MQKNISMATIPPTRLRESSDFHESTSCFPIEEPNPMSYSPHNPSVVKRPRDRQQAIDEETSALALYYYETCMFCIRVRRTIARLGLKIELRNIRAVPAYREHLLQGGGKSTVPCLLIHKEDGSTEWLYESQTIIDYLERRFAH